MEGDPPNLTIHERMCRLLTAIWALFVAVDISIYVAPGAGRQCPKVDDDENTSSAQLRNAFIIILIAHIFHVCMCGGAQGGVNYIASWPEGNVRKPELQGCTESENKKNNFAASYVLLAIGGFLSAWATKALGSGSLSNIPAEDCLHGTFRLAWFRLLLWLANAVFLVGLGVLVVAGLIGTWFLGLFVYQDILAIYKACCTSKPEVEVLTESKGLETSAV